MVDVIGIDHHKHLQKPVCSACGIIIMYKGEMLAILNQYAGFHMGKNSFKYVNGGIRHVS